ncbi:hypothetical protein BDV12DRAFT_178394 [Aspergillus spectabilis]
MLSLTQTGVNRASSKRARLLSGKPDGVWTAVTLMMRGLAAAEEEGEGARPKFGGVDEPWGRWGCNCSFRFLRVASQILGEGCNRLLQGYGPCWSIRTHPLPWGSTSLSHHLVS